MRNDYLYIRLYSNENMGLSNLKIRLKNKCNKIIFAGLTDKFRKVKIPLCDNEVYKLLVYTNLSIVQVPLIARKNNLYCINIGDQKRKEQLVTIILMDKNYPNIKIEGGKMILWQDIQSQ